MMESLPDDSFLIFSSTDSSGDPLGEETFEWLSTKPRHLPDSINSVPRRNSLGSIDASPYSKTPEDNGELLRFAVATALGIDASSLPQPFHESQNGDDSNSIYSNSSDSQHPLDEATLIRKDSVSSASVYSSPIDISEWRKSMGTSIEERITAIIASVLGLDNSSLRFDESFIELGGNQRKAMELRAKCMDDGLVVKTKDIMNCKTIAELETYVTPLISSEYSENNVSTAAVSPLKLISSENPLSSTKRPASPKRGRPPAIPPKAPARYAAAQSYPTTRPSRRRYNQVEQVLTSHSDVSRAIVLKPKAGPFEDQLIAFVTLTGCPGEGPDDCEVKLLYNFRCTSQLPPIRKVVESRMPSGLIPRLWVVLEKMPLDDAGENNRRKLQTWIQNANDELYRQIISADSKAKLKLLITGAVRQHTPLNRLAAPAYFPSNVSQLEGSGETMNISFDLLPMQRLYFHTSTGNNYRQRNARNGDYRFHQSMLFRLNQNMDVVDIRAAVEAVVGHHCMLRCRFRLNGSSWLQSIESDISSSYHFSCHLAGTDTELEEIIRVAQGVIDIETGPTFAAYHLRAPDGRQMLYLIAHHLVVDLKSWGIIIDDLGTLLTSGCLVSNRSLSFEEWSVHQMSRAQRVGYSFNIPEGTSQYWGVDPAFNTYGNVVAIGFTLDENVTSALEANCRELTMDVADIFMASLILSFARTFRDRPVPILWNQDNERCSSGTDRDVSDTVGWFTALYPFTMKNPPTEDILAIIDGVKDSRRVNAKNGPLQFAGSLADTASALSFASSHCPLELVFTYSTSIAQRTQSQSSLLEQVPMRGETLAFGTSDIGCNVGRIALFEVSIMAEQGETNFKILYHRDSAHQERIRDWFIEYETTVHEVINKLQIEARTLPSSSMSRVEVTDGRFGQGSTAILPRLGLNLSDLETIRPATIVQQDILTSQSLIPGSYNAQTIYDLDTSDGPIDISRICASWLKVSEKHSALKSIFSQSFTKNVLYDQLVLRSHSPNMLFLESDSVEDAMMSLKNLPPLSFSEGVPWHRLVVCKVAGKTLLKLEISQALCDVASMAILFRELEQAYFDGKVAPGSEVSHSEYMRCLKVTASSINFWREHLYGAQPCRFPKLISPNSALSRWETTSTDLKASSERLKTFSKNYKINISTVLQIAWGLLLRTYIGTDNVCFGFRISGRDLPIDGLNEAVGSFSTVLPFRLTIPPGESIGRLLLHAEDQRRRMLDHQHVPLTRIEHELKIKGGRLFNTCLSFGYEYVSNGTPTTTKCRHIRTEQASDSDVSIDVYFRNGNITVDIGSRILTSEQATTVACAFGRAIEAIMDMPISAVKEIDLFSVRDHKQILAWNSMPRVDVSKELVQQLIAKQALLNPDIEAVCSWEGSLSYDDLLQFSIVLAKHLLASGLKPQTPVPVIVEKGRWAIVAMLAVFYTGAILVPVDAELISSLAWVIKTVNPGFVLASDHVQRCVDGLSAKVVVVNGKTVSAMSAQVVDMTLPQPTLCDIACILFDTRSSGNAKGISYSHAALATACVGQGSTLLINPSSRVMQVSSYSVDIALSEVFTPLVNGGCVCIPSSSERIADFSGAARRMRVNWTYLTPALSRKIDPESLPEISVVCFRTRSLDSDAYVPWVNKATKVLLAYGCAEICPLGLSATELTLSKTSQCFGSPFCGNFWIVSPEDNNRLTPVGALGELVIGGPTLATSFDVSGSNIKAWISKSKSRARSLLKNPGGHLLKTGHCVRYLGDGEIELVSDSSEETTIDGRKFHHSEIEPKLRQCLGRGVGVVVETIAFNDPDSAPVLAAFVELGEILLQDNGDLLSLNGNTRERLRLLHNTADMVLRETLPSHMVPSVYIPVKHMPLTATLDINRLELQRAISRYSRKQLLGLTGVSNSRDFQDASFKPLPLTQVELQMRRIWAHVLDIEEGSIKAGDGFLGLGGDVVLAHDLIVECKQRNISISIIDVLRDVPLSSLCKGIATTDVPSRAVRDDRVAKSSRPDSFVNEAIVPQLGSDKSVIEDVAEASYIQTMFIESGMLQTRGNINYLAINIAGLLDWRKLEAACSILTKAHPVLRTAFVSHGRQLYQTVLRSYHPEFLRFQCQSWRLSNLAAKIIKRERSEPPDFRRPITKFFYLDAGKSSMLLIRLSRAQYDDFCAPVLAQDLGRFYSLSCNDRVTPRPGFCEIVRATQSTHSSYTSEYWSALLAGATMTQIVSRPSPAGINLNSTALRRQISVGSLQSLGIPFETILKGAWSVVLSNLSGTDDVVFGQLIEGKNLSLPTSLAISHVVGPMGNVMPVRTRLPSVPITPYEYFRHIQSQYVSSVAHENMQTSDIVRKCTPWPSWTRFSTVVCHRNEAEDYRSTNFIIGSASCKLSCMESSHQEWDILVQSTASEAANVDISLMFCEKRLPMHFADDILRMLCSIITLLTSSFVMDPIVLKGLGDNYSISRIPLPIPKRELAMPSMVESVDPDLARGVHAVISAAWDTILEARSLRVPDIRSVPFYEIWGALMPAAELARYYTENMHTALGIESVSFAMEEIIDHPTMMQQYELAIAKKHNPQLRRSRSPMSIGTQSAWGKGIRRLGGAPNPTNATPSSYPIRHYHKPSGSGGSASMTMESSQSDEEVGGDILSGSSVIGTKKAATKSRDVKATKKGATLLGRMMIPAISS